MGTGLEDIIATTLCFVACQAAPVEPGGPQARCSCSPGVGVPAVPAHSPGVHIERRAQWPWTRSPTHLIPLITPILHLGLSLVDQPLWGEVLHLNSPSAPSSGQINSCYAWLQSRIPTKDSHHHSDLRLGFGGCGFKSQLPINDHCAICGLLSFSKYAFQ